MKALSIKQPWAALIVHGFKPVENRDWHCNYRGPLLIHAGKQEDTEGLMWLINNWHQAGMSSTVGDFLDKIRHGRLQLERGGIVGRVQMTGCVQHHPSPFFFGPYGFTLEQPEVLPFKSWRGQLKIFEIPDGALS